MWLTGWTYRKPVSVDNRSVGASGAATVAVPFEDGMRSDFGDVRFTDADGATPLLALRESMSSGVSAAYSVNVWAAAAVAKTIFCYFGKPAATYAPIDPPGAADHDHGWLRNSGNPVVPLGTSGQWDDYSVYSPCVLEEGGTTYLYYGGSRNTANPRVEQSVGLATSTDGETFTKQGKVIDRANHSLGGTNQGLIPFDIIKIGSTYYLFLMRYDHPLWQIAMMESTDRLSWSNLTVVVDDFDWNHCPQVIEDPADESKLIMYFGYSLSGDFALGRATASKSAPYIWTLGTNPVMSVPGSLVLYPHVRWTGEHFELLYCKGPISGKFKLFKSASRTGLTFPDSSLLALDTGSGWDDNYVACPRRNGDKLRYTARATGQDYYGGIGQCEWHEVGSLTQWDIATGNVEASTDHARSGTHGIKLTGAAPAPANVPSVTKFARGKGWIYEVWIYDDLSTVANFQNNFRLVDTAGDSSVLVGIWTGTSTTKYIYRTKGGSWTASSIDRTTGWHRLSFEVKDDVKIRVDDTLLATDTVFDTDTLDRVMLYGYSAGVGYADDYAAIPLEAPVIRVGTEVAT